MRLNLDTEEFAPPENQEWLGSAHGTQEADSITLDTSTFTGTFTNGIVPSGVVVSEGGDGRYVYGHEGGGRVGHLLTTKDISKGGNVSAALMWHGQVLVDKLPENHGLVTAAAEAMSHVDYVGEVPTS